MMGPPADREYAVEPVGVLNTTPSARYLPMRESSAYTEKSDILPPYREAYTSLSAVYTPISFPSRQRAARSIIR